MSNTPEIPDKTLLRPDEVAALFRVSMQSIYNWVKRGDLPCVRRIGQPIRFRRTDIIDILNTNDDE